MPIDIRPPDSPIAGATGLRAKLPTLVTVLSTITAALSAVAMADQVRAVEILGLFASGFGAGAGVAALVARHRR